MKTIILKPIVTEKATALEKDFTYGFWVNKTATKIDIKNAIKKIYGGDVATVRIINTPAKTKIIRRMVVDKRRAMKKALVTMKGKKKLDVAKLEKKEETKEEKKTKKEKVNQ